IDKADNGGFGVAPTKKKPLSARGVDYKSFVRIGSTYYDLQTNFAMPHRIALHSFGPVSAAWTTANSDAAGFASRGSGYNYRDESGKWNPSDSSRVENVRTGWANIGVLSNGSVFTIGHDATNGGFYMAKSASATSRPSTTTSILQEPPYKPIWARTANNGDVIHLICSYTDSASPGEARAPRRKGIFAPMVYSRSKDGGTTWDKQHVMLPDYDSTLTNNGGADQYTIDVKGNTVAIVNADLLQGVIAWKSTDGGDNWQRIIVDTFKYAPWTGKTEMLDTPYTNDGTVDVIIDNNNKLHVFFGLGRVLDTDTTDESYSFYPGTQGMMHWSEATDKTSLIASGNQFDRDEDGFNGLEQATYAALSGGNVPSGLSTVARLGSTSALRQPASAMDANGNLYCLFSVPIEQDISDLGANFRDIGVVYSTDGGATWSLPQNVTQVLGREDDFASTCRVANGFLHMTWQQDEIAGTNLQNNSGAFGNHPVVLNLINYQAIPVTEILKGNIGMLYGVNVEKPNTGAVMVVNQNYPNPFSNETNVMVYLTNPGDIKVEVRNAMGALVKTQTHSNLYKGNHELTISANGLSTGVYTYTLIAGGSSVSKTMMVK
ncbi:MAG: T9SS type A sorting domain-containing protein, partial [Bacteroidota bacterium]